MIATRFNPLGTRPKSTSKDYIQDGLIYHFDAIDNAIDGSGNRYHNPTPTVWKNLVGDKDLSIGSSGVTFGDNFANFVGTILQNESANLGSNGAKRVEVVFAVDANGFTDGVLNNAILVSGVPYTNLRLIWIGVDGTDTAIGNGYHFEEPSIVYPITQGAVITASIPYNLRISSTNTFVDGNSQAIKNVIKRIYLTSSGLTVGRNFYGKICAVRIYTDNATAEEALYHATIDKERFGVSL